jgi:hypothetical protein
MVQKTIQGNAKAPSSARAGASDMQTGNKANLINQLKEVASL